MVIGHELVSKFSKGASSIQIKNILKLIFLPVIFPILIYQIVGSFRRKFGLQKRPLEGKVVVITGASSGIGESLARLLYASGCRLILASRRKEELERVKTELVRTETYGPVYVPAIITLDLEDLKSIPTKAIGILEIYGYVDILINNAGVSFRGAILETNLNVDQRVMSINFFGPLELTRQILHSMVERKNGRVVFISSVQGKIAIPFSSAYAASKHALQAMADSLRAEIHEDNVKVTVISPSCVNTSLPAKALTATGDAQGSSDEMKPTGGYSPNFIARKTVAAILRNENEITISGFVPKLMIFFRYFSPSLFFRSMASNAAASESN